MSEKANFLYKIVFLFSQPFTTHFQYKGHPSLLPQVLQRYDTSKIKHFIFKDLCTQFSVIHMGSFLLYILSIS